MLKKDIRQKYKSLRAQLTQEQLEEQSFEIAQRLLELNIWNKTYFHLYLSIDSQKEVCTEPLLNILFAKNKEVVLPKSDFNSFEMSHLLLTENTRIQKNKYGIPEPLDGIEVPLAKIEVVFVPLLAFDTMGNRVGYGKGFYDRFLKKTTALKIGLSVFEPEARVEDVLPEDVSLDYCVTPLKTYQF